MNGVVGFALNTTCVQLWLTLHFSFIIVILFVHIIRIAVIPYLRSKVSNKNVQAIENLTHQMTNSYCRTQTFNSIIILSPLGLLPCVWSVCSVDQRPIILLTLLWLQKLWSRDILAQLFVKKINWTKFLTLIFTCMLICIQSHMLCQAFWIIGC